MTVEAATSIDGFNTALPDPNDGKSEGDDHLRLIKAVLQQVFPNFAGRFNRFQTKSANYNLTTTDNGSIVAFTGGTTATATAVATLGNGWFCFVLANGVDITIDPNASELVDGATTQLVPNGTGGFLWCDGTQFFFFPIAKSFARAQNTTVASISGNVTLTAADFNAVKVVSATADITLPAVSAGVVGNFIRFKSTTTGLVRLLRQGGDTVDTLTGYTVGSFNTVEITITAAGAYTITQKPDHEVGNIIMHGASVAPNGWQGCDGSALSRTTFAGLFAAIGTAYGAGDGSTTFNVPDHRGRQPLGVGQGSTAETVAAASVTTATDTFTVGNNADKWITGMKVQLTTTGALPTPLALATDYFVIRNTSTTIKFATSTANALAGTAIDLTTQGSGNHTVTYSMTTRTVGDILGEETHLQLVSETPPHGHGVTDPGHPHDVPTGPNDIGPSGWISGVSTVNPATPTSGYVSSGVTNISIQSTGGGTPLNKMQPAVVHGFLIKT